MGNSLIRLVAAAWLAATATQAGAEEVKFTVTGTGGAPISGAAVAVYARGMRSRVAHGKTDGAGVLAVDLNRKPEYDLAVYAEGCKLHLKRDTRLAASESLRLAPRAPTDRLAVLAKNGPGAALFGGGDQDVRMAVSYTGEWQFDIEAGNTEVLLGKRDPDGAVLRRVNIGQSFVAKKGTRKVECRLACFIPDVGLILEF